MAPRGITAVLASTKCQNEHMQHFFKQCTKATRIQNSKTLTQLCVINVEKFWFSSSTETKSDRYLALICCIFYKYVYYKRITPHPTVCCPWSVKCVANFIPFLEHVLTLDMKYLDAHSGFCHQPLWACLGWKWRDIQSHPKAARCPAWWSAAVLWSRTKLPFLPFVVPDL